MALFAKRVDQFPWLTTYDFTQDRFTPDAHKLDQMLWHRMFIYNEMQSGQPKHSLLGPSSVKAGAAFTRDSNFVVMKKKLGAETFPFALEMTESNRFGRETYLGPAAKIHGQMFMVEPDTIKRLDKHLLNTVQFDRKRISIDIPFREKEGPWVSDKKVMRVKAWAYIGRSDFWIEGHEINDYYCGRVKHFAHVKSILNSEKDTSVYYYYDHRFEISS